MIEDRLSRYNSILKQSRFHSEALRQCRDRLDNLDDYDQIFLHVYAPSLVEYVKWVLRSAGTLRIERLYFLARDSWLAYQLATRMVQALGLDIEIRYLQVSRYSLRNAEYSFIGREALETICVGGIDITFRKLMRRANLSDEEIFEVAREIGFVDRIDECLSYVQIQELKDRLYSCDRLFEYIDEHSGPAYIMTEEYLRQQGLCDDVHYAIVDSGWVGTTQMSLNRVVESITGRNSRIKGFYFGLYEIPAGANLDDYFGYYIKPNQDFDRKTRFSICLYETVMSSPKGMTLGYRYCAGRVQPIYNQVGNPNERQMRKSRRLLMEYVKSLELNTEFVNTDEVHIIEQLLMLSMGSPTKDEAKAMGALQFCDDVLESQMQSVARKWNFKELYKQNFFMKVLIKFSKSNIKLHESGWPEGSIVNLCGEGFFGEFALINERLYKKGMYLRKARINKI